MLFFFGFSLFDLTRHIHILIVSQKEQKESLACAKRTESLYTTFHHIALFSPFIGQFGPQHIYFNLQSKVSTGHLGNIPSLIPLMTFD